jgi:hypothetical protein
MLWIRYTSEGGGNDNAIIMFLVLLLLNCLGVCAVFIRRRVLWSRGLLTDTEKNETATEEEEEVESTTATEVSSERQVKEQRVAVVQAMETDDAMRRRGRKAIKDSLAVKGNKKKK